MAGNLKLILPVRNDEEPRATNSLRRSVIVNTDSLQNIHINCEDLKPVRNIGEGGFGTVFEMVHTKSNLVFAVKRIPDYKINNKNGQIMDMKVPLLAGDSQFLVKYYGALHAEGHIWILNELMGTSMDFFYMKCFEIKINMPIELLSNLTYSVLEAISFLEEKGILHRDIKPSNILINSEGDIKLGDFGVSGITVDNVARTLEMGSYPYIPLERIRSQNQQGYSVRSDVWSLGITLIEIATGEHPYKNLSSLLQLDTIMNGDEPRLNQQENDNDLCDFVAKCLRANEYDRLHPNEALMEPFITTHRNASKNLDFIQNIINKVTEDNNRRNSE